MTLDEAVAVLNERRHDDFDAWAATTNGRLVIGDGGNHLKAFEAIAVAEKYLRDEPRTTATGETL